MDRRQRQMCIRDRRRGLLPDMRIALPEAWDGELPAVPEGFAISAIATDLMVPRQSIVLPNGDILVAEGSGGGAPALRPKDVIANYVKGCLLYKSPSPRDRTSSRMPSSA